MKKLTLIIAAVSIGLVMSSCHQPTKDDYIQLIDQYYTESEQKLDSITDPEDFVFFAEDMNDIPSIFEEIIEEQPERTLSNEDKEAIRTFIKERSTAYNKAETIKCGELIPPYIDSLENATNFLFEQFKANEPFNDSVVSEYIEARINVSYIEEVCKNIPTELRNRIGAIQAIVEEMGDPWAEKIKKLMDEETE